MQPSPRIKLILVYRVDLLTSEKDGILFQEGETSLRKILFGETPKQTGVPSAGLAVSFSELLAGGIANTGSFAIPVRCSAFRLGLRRGMRHSLRFFGYFVFHAHSPFQCIRPGVN